MFRNFFGGSSKKKKEAAETAEAKALKELQSHVGKLTTKVDPRTAPKTILVIDGGEQSSNWAQVFRGACVRLPDPSSVTSHTGNSSSGDAATVTATTKEQHISVPINVVQCSWNDLQLAAYSDMGNGRSGVIAHVRKRSDKGDKKETLQPDFVLIRNEVRGVGPKEDYRTVLYGLMYAQIPSLNSWESILMTCERPVAHSWLLKVQARLGRKAFPVVKQSYYANHRDMNYWEPFPNVVKIGHGQAGYGKIKCSDHRAFADVRSVIAQTSQYCTGEPFINGKYDLRIQKIGAHYRVYKRQSISGNWKTNVGASVIEETELTPKYKMWADEAAKAFGGLGIVTVDAIHCADTGAEYILEMNGTSSGFLPSRQDEDNGHVRALVLRRMEKLASDAADCARRIERAQNAQGGSDAGANAVGSNGVHPIVGCDAVPGSVTLAATAKATK